MAQSEARSIQATTFSAKPRIRGDEVDKQAIIDAEKRLLGSMVLSTEHADRALSVLDHRDTSCFEIPAHQTLFKIVVELYEECIPIDLVSVKDKLCEHALLETIGGAEYLIDLVQFVDSWEGIERDAEILRNRNIVR